MRKLLISVALAFSLAGCAGTLPPVTGTTPADDIIANATLLAGKFCNIGPTAASIINIFVSNPLLTTAEDLARAFCAAITPKPTLTGLAGPRPLVHGMVVKGSYLGRPIAGKVL